MGHARPPALGGPTNASRTKALYERLLANGITGLRDAGSQTPLDTFRVLKQEIAAGRLAGPRLIVSGPSIEDTVGSRWVTNDTAKLKLPGMQCLRGPCKGGHFASVTDPADARHLVDSLKSAGADMIKLYGPTPPIYFAAAAEARRLGIPFGGHVYFSRPGPWPDGLDGLTASDSGARILDHELYVANVCGQGQDSTVLSLARCAAVAARLRRNHTWVSILEWSWMVPGPKLADTAARHAFERRAMRYAEQPLSAAERRQRVSSREWAAFFGDSALPVHGANCPRVLLTYAADLPILPGLDFPYGELGASVHHFLLYPVLCGVPPLWALQRATLEPARALGLTDSLGTVAAGKVADLVLLEGDPLADIWNVTKIAAVVANGRYFDRAALDRLLAETGRALAE